MPGYWISSEDPERPAGFASAEEYYKMSDHMERTLSYIYTRWTKEVGPLPGMLEVSESGYGLRSWYQYDHYSELKEEYLPLDCLWDLDNQIAIAVAERDRKQALDKIESLRRILSSEQSKRERVTREAIELGLIPAPTIITQEG